MELEDNRSNVKSFEEKQKSHDLPPPSDAAASNQPGERRKKRRRWGDAAAAPALPPTATATAAAAAVVAMDPKAKILAMQANIRNKLAVARLAAGQGVAPPPSNNTAAPASTTSGVGVSSQTLNIKERLAAAKARQQQQQQQSALLAVPGSSSSSSSSSAAASLKRPPEELAAEERQKQPAKRAKHYELDLSVTAPTFKQQPKQQQSKTAAAAAALSGKTNKNINPYLMHHEEDEENNNDDDHDIVVDDRLVRSSKPRERKREIKFVEPGKWQEIAERKREKVVNAQASGFLSGRKTGHSIQSTSMGDIYGSSGTTAAVAAADVDDYWHMYSDGADLPPRWDAHPDTKMPLVMEWWDLELLPPRLKKQVAAAEAQEIKKQSKAALLQASLDQPTPEEAKKEDATEQEDPATTDNNSSKQEEMEKLQRTCFEKAALSYSKTAELVQHIVPIKPPNTDTGPQKEPVLHLTKAELKRQRKLRRQDKLRELQDLQAAGLIPAPEPRLTLKNFIRVLGDQAFLDPSQMEKKVNEQVRARQQAHLERNEASKLSKEQRAAKRAKKLEEDTSQGVAVAIFLVKDMSHPYHRAKVDLNAQQLNITGGVLECQRPTLSCVICEGGPKAVKRYVRLMTVRMKWTGPDDADEQEDDHDDSGDMGMGDGGDSEQATPKPPKFNAENKCELVWQGMAVKRLFNSFLFQSCETSEQARKVLKAKGVAHYWDQVLQSVSGQGAKFQLKLAEEDDNSDADDNPYDRDNEDEEDIIMKEE
jgi:U4/U6 small nuclear ribonucleoprotein PRP3